VGSAFSSGRYDHRTRNRGWTFDDKTAVEQESWWEEYMSGKTHEITGEIVEVEWVPPERGYWRDLDVGRNVRVACHYGQEFEATAKSLRKGSRFTCKGLVAKTWTPYYGVLFFTMGGGNWHPGGGVSSHEKGGDF
jgi:hypothetical protein